MKKTTGVGGCVAVFALLLAGRVWGASCYVVPTNAAAAEPYDTWAKAATSIQTAVDYASDHLDTYNAVIVSNGTYRITNQITIAKAITVCSFGNGVYGGLANASNTVVRHKNGTTRVFSVANTDAVLYGLTISNGGGGQNGISGGGVYITGGTVSNCVITGNTAASAFATGGGVYMTGGLLASCLIYGNYDAGDGTGGGGVYMNGGTVRNCLIFRNRTDSIPAGGGVRLDGGTLESCTIVSNTTGNASGGGGIYRKGGTAGTVRNCIVYYNTATNADNKNMYSTTDAGVSYCCITNPAVAGDGCIADDPLFADLAGGDYRLQYAPLKSPCIDAGLNADWMPSAADVEGHPRIFRGVVDMGACEAWPAVPMLLPAGVVKMTDKTATLRCNVVWPGPVEAALFVCHGPDDGGGNRQAWANEIRVPGPIGAGIREIGISHSASNRTWCYRWFATNVNGVAWADSTSGLTLGAVEVKATKRESTEEKPSSFVITRPAAASNGPLDVYFTMSGTGVNGTDYDALESPAVIPAGATEVRLAVVPSFGEDDKRAKGVELTIAPGGYQVGLNGKASIVTKAQ